MNIPLDQRLRQGPFIRPLAATGALAIGTALVYFAAAELGLSMAFEAGQVSAVWPPTGIALAAVLLFGYRVWPGIALAAFLANANAGEPVATAAGIALGNTLESLTGAWLLRRIIGFRPALDRLRDVLGLILLSAGVCTALAATIGTLSLCLGGVQKWSMFGKLWMIWWLGDAMGALVMAPLLLTWSAWRQKVWPLGRLVEAFALAGSLVVVALVIFDVLVPPGGMIDPLIYLIFPFVIWAALRFGPPGATTVTFVTSAIAIWGTLHNEGPFGRGLASENLILLQVFMAVVAVTGLLLGAAIAERQLAEEDRRERLESWQVTLSSIGDAVLVTDAADRVTFLNPVAESLSGWSGQEAAGKPLAHVFRTTEDERRDRLETPPPLGSNDSSIMTLDSDTILVARDGTRRPVDVVAAPIRDRQGKTRGSVLIFHDVTERRQAENALRRSEERYRSLVAATSSIVWNADPQGNFTELQPSWEAYTGQTWEEYRGWGWAHALHAQDRPRVKAVWTQALAERKPFDMQARVWNAGAGQYHYCLGRAVPLVLTGKEVREWVGAISDIDLIKRAEHEIHYQQDLLRTITDNADSALVMVDVRGRFTYINPAFTRFTGLTEADVRGKSVHEAVHWKHPDGRLFPVCECPIDNAFGKRAAIRSHEDVFVRKDGTFFPVVVAVVPLEKEGKIIGGLIEFRDVTRQKVTEEALKEANRRKDEFLAMLAHELRNPLASIGTATHLLDQPGDDDSQWARQVIQRQVKHLARLVDDLLDVSRITRGLIQLRKELLDPLPILYRALDAVRPLIDERRHQLRLSFSAVPMRVDADPTRLEQIVVNLLTNASKYTEDGGQIWLSAEPDRGQLVIRVRDTGIGIPPEVLPQVFELFAQGSRSMARSEGGLGIGLTLVRKLVDLHAGRVTAASPGIGRGSEFTVRLPLAHTAPGGIDRHDPLAASLPVSSNSSRILVVDDNIETARGMARLLQRSGHHVQTAHDGPQALDLARKHRPDFVLLDLGLPGMDGFQVAEQLRKEDWGRQPVLVAITGYGREEDRQRSRQAGFDHHLIKPIDYDTLMSLIGERVS